MNCRIFHKRAAELFDVCPDPATTADLIAHAAECSKCGQELAELRELMSRITPAQRLHASHQVKERIMNSIVEQDALREAGTTGRPRYQRILRVAALTAVLLAAIFAAGRLTNRPSAASTTLAQAAEFLKGVTSMHMTARMRTTPVENFDAIDLTADLVPIQIWKRFGEQPKVRIEKSNRQIIADGDNTTLMIEAGGSVLARRFSGLAEGCFETLAPLLRPDSLFRHESELARESGSGVDIKSEVGPDGREKTILTIDAKAMGDFSASEHAKNRSIVESDNVRIYTFDAETYRCERIQVFVRTDHGKVLVFETTGIDYDQPLDSSLFQANVPKSAICDSGPDESGAQDNSWMRPDEFAERFFEALSRSDWKTARSYGATWLDTPQYHKVYGGLTVVSIGEPFKSGLYPGYFVPYEIKFKSGQVKKFKLAVRNDNPKHQWTWDGGL